MIVSFELFRSMEGLSGRGSIIFSTDAGSIGGRRKYTCQTVTPIIMTGTASAPEIDAFCRQNGIVSFFPFTSATVTLGSISTRYAPTGFAMSLKMDLQFRLNPQVRPPRRQNQHLIASAIM